MNRVALLAGPADVEGFRRAARRLIGAGIEPHQIDWQIAGEAEAGLFEGEAADPALPAAGTGEAAAGAAPTVPRSFLQLVDAVALHQDRGRYALLYQLLWRLQREPQLRDDPLDPQWLRAHQMARAVRRDQHKMKAFVRFRPIDRTATGEPPLHVAWFEPSHHIVEAMAPFFVRRFAQMHWSILTPRSSISWDGKLLQHAPGAQRADAPAADAGEALWLTYYRNIFNPARLKLAMMRQEMPRRYWHNLPEAVLIQPLAAAAHQRSGRMIERPARAPDRALRRLMPAAARTIVRAPDPSAMAYHDAAPAERADALDATRRAARDCTRCPLYGPATQTVFGAGPVDAGLMFVGEQPGDQEDLRGQPFVGPAGQLFDKALAQLGIERAAVYVTNAVKHFKFELRGKRRIHKTPAQQEAAACLDWLEREIALVRPRAIVALGATAARTLMGRPVAVTRERGHWLERSDGIAVLVTLHPSALLRMPPAERDTAWQAWLRDLALVRPGAADASPPSGPGSV